MISPLKLFKKQRPPQVSAKPADGFGISNFDQEAVLAEQRRRCLQPPPPVVIARNPKPNGEEAETPVVLMPDKLPNLDLPAFRYLQFKR
ncbi:MAG: hypothetical protein HC845_00035 [Akkermansiaceae bacterium]|nr:hypothetical protein [Akkermansiaceae bacterium]